MSGLEHKENVSSNNLEQFGGQWIKWFHFGCILFGIQKFRPQEFTFWTFSHGVWLIFRYYHTNRILCQNVYSNKLWEVCGKLQWNSCSDIYEKLKRLQWLFRNSVILRRFVITISNTKITIWKSYNSLWIWTWKLGLLVPHIPKSPI